MWNRRHETQAEAADAVAQPLAPVSAVPPAGGAPETEAPPSLEAETQGPRAGEQHAAAAEGTMNGAAVQPTPPALDEKAQHFWLGKLAIANFGGAVALFTRSPAHRHYTLADLEWCLVPALMLNQFMMVEAKLPDGQAVPIGLVLWARVSAEIDARLSAAPRYPIRLHTNEWQSGDVIWIIDAVGVPKAVQQCIDALAKTVFKGKQFKMLTAGDKTGFAAHPNQASD
jgi:hemolysin-activating ACP:hemolysin acyltransferase